MKKNTTNCKSFKCVATPTGVKYIPVQYKEKEA